MRTPRLALAVLLASLQSTAENAFDLGHDLRVLPAIQHGALSVFPVVRRVQGTARAGKVLALAAGLERKQVAVEEVGGGTVNQLRVINRSEQPVLLLGGEILLGGRQDRVVAHDQLVPPGANVVVQVFCVEHGRWAGGQQFGAAAGFAEGGLRARAKYDGDQGRVWQQVAKKARALGAQSSTGTYRTLAAGKAGESVAAPYRAAIGARIGAHPEAQRMVGIVAAVGGRVVSVDVFAAPELFAQYRDRMLDSLYVTAADEPAAAAAAPPPQAAQVKAFWSSAKSAPRREIEKNAASTTTENRAQGVVGSEVNAKGADVPVFESVQAHH